MLVSKIWNSGLIGKLTVSFVAIHVAVLPFAVISAVVDTVQGKSSKTEVKSEPTKNVTSVQPKTLTDGEIYAQDVRTFKGRLVGTSDGKEMLERWYSVGHEIGKGHEYAQKQTEAAMYLGCQDPNSRYHELTKDLNCKVIISQNR